VYQNTGSGIVNYQSNAVFFIQQSDLGNGAEGFKVLGSYRPTWSTGAIGYDPSMRRPPTAPPKSASWPEPACRGDLWHRINASPGIQTSGLNQPGSYVVAPEAEPVFRRR